MSRAATLAGPLVCLALCAGLGSTGCALGIVDVPPDDPPPPALTIAGPRDALAGEVPTLAYTAADDEDPEALGIQLTLRVDVDDEAIDRVALELPQQGVALDDVVSEDLAGRRAAFFGVSLAGAVDGDGQPVVARASQVAVQAVLVAVAR